jgi:hypothetical protein
VFPGFRTLAARRKERREKFVAAVAWRRPAG